MHSPTHAMSDSCGTQRRSWRLPEGSRRARWSAIGRMSRAVSRRRRGSYTFVQGIYDFTREDVSLSEYRKRLPGAFRLQPLRQPGEFESRSLGATFPDIRRTDDAPDTSANDPPNPSLTP